MDLSVTTEGLFQVIGEQTIQLRIAHNRILQLQQENEKLKKELDEKRSPDAGL